jgi:hypothetical protein
VIGGRRPLDPQALVARLAALERPHAPYFADYDEILFTPEARQAHWTRIDRDAPRLWRVRQTLLDPEGDNLWHLEGVVDLSPGTSLEGPLVSLRRLGT